MAKKRINKFPAEKPTILHLVKQVQYKAYMRLESVFQPLGVTAVQFRILTTLSAQPGITSAELSRLYGVKPQTMIKQIALLEGKHLIARKPSSHSRRVLELRLTEEGQRVLAHCRTDAEAIESDVLRSLDKDEEQALRSLLERVLASFSDDTPAPAEEFSPEFSRAGVQR